MRVEERGDDEQCAWAKSTDGGGMHVEQSGLELRAVSMVSGAGESPAIGRQSYLGMMMYAALRQRQHMHMSSEAEDNGIWRH